MDLNIYLLRAGVQLGDLVPSSDNWRELSHRNDRPGLRAFARQAESSTPPWVRWVETEFDFGDERPESASTAMLLLLTVKQRVLVATFGTGWRSVPTEHIERDFGLIVALNQVRAEQLRHLVTKTMELRTRERSTYNHAGSDLRGFDLDVDVEWLRSAGGRSTRDDCTLIAGADALKLKNYAGKISELRNLCGELLAIFAKGPPETFRFIQNVRPIPQNDVLHGQLESELLKIIGSPRPGKQVEVILDAAMGADVSSAVMSSGRRDIPIEDVHSEDVWRALRELRQADPGMDLHRVSLRIALGTGDEHRLRLLDTAQAEVAHDGQTYLRLEQR